MTTFIPLLIFVLFYDLNVWALDRTELKNLQKISLDYVVRQQTLTTGPVYLAGEWPSQVEITGFPNKLGLGVPHQLVDDPTAFVTASIVNLLHDAFSNSDTLTEVKSLINNALPSFADYKDEPTQSYFFFPTVKLQSGQTVHYPRLLRAPKLLSGGFLIPPDSDTTSVIILAMIKADQAALSPESLRTLAQYRDINRRPHEYNKKYSDEKTGAYLTWLKPEKNRKDQLYFLPKGLRDPRIPLGRNDVDCVVNSNILRLLSYTQNFYLKSEIYLANSPAGFNEGVFFSAYPPLRNLANWRSKSFTAALALKVFTQLEHMELN